MPRNLAAKTGRPPFSGLADFVANLPSPAQMLGLTHVTSSYSLRDIILAGSITATEPCDVLGEPLSYAFYGKAAFRGGNELIPTSLACLFPSVLVLDPTRVPAPKYVFGFDSGAFVKGMMDQYLHPYMPLFDFLLVPTPMSAAKLVNAIFKDTNDFFLNRPTWNLDVSSADFETDCYRQIVAGAGGAVHLAQQTEISLGSGEVFAVVDPKGRVYAGTKAELSPVVKDFIADIRSPLTKMNFARFCGNNLLAKKAASEAIDAKSIEFENREKAVRWFIDAVILRDLLRIISRSCDAKIRNDVFKDTSVEVELFKNDRASIRLPKDLLMRKDRTVRRYRYDLAQLLGFANSATGYEFDLIEIENVKETVTLDFSSQIAPNRKLREAIKTLETLPRQEARFANIVNLLVDDPRLGVAVLKFYKDKSKFAQNALDTLRQQSDKTYLGRDREAAIATLLPRIISAAFPLQKDRLLWELARRLGKHYLLAQVVERITTKSNSAFISKGAILDELNAAKRSD